MLAEHTGYDLGSGEDLRGGEWRSRLRRRSQEHDNATREEYGMVDHGRGGLTQGVSGDRATVVTACTRWVR